MPLLHVPRPVLPSPVEAVLFDMDGLLFDTEKIYLAALVESIASVGYAIPDAFCRSMIGVSSAECDRMIRGYFGADFPYAVYERKWEELRNNALRDGIPLMPGAVELLNALETSGVPKALVTTSSRRTATRYLNESTLGQRFDVMVTHEDVSRHKPHPDPYLKAAETLGIRPERCVVLEDSHPGIRAAHAANAMPVFVPDLVPPTPEIHALCAAVVADLHEVRRMLGGR